MAEDTLLYSSFTSTRGWKNPRVGTGRVGFGNLAKDYSALNRKNMRQTDNKGYPLSYVVEVEAIGDTAMAHKIEIFTAPETWVLKNAVRKWHAARNMMLARVDATGKVGEYSKTIRPYLSVAHARYGAAGFSDIIPSTNSPNSTTTISGTGNAQTEANSDAVTSSALRGGEWTYTEIANTIDVEEDHAPNVDRYHLVLCGDHDNTTGTVAGSGTNHKRIYTHVSMMRSYLESRRNASSIIQDPSGGGSIQTEPSPLLNLMADSNSTGEVKEIVQDLQREKPPYDPFTSLEDGALNGNDAVDMVQKCMLSTSTTYLKDKEVIRIPLGLFHIRATAQNNLAGGGSLPQLRVRLLGIDKCQG